MIAATNSAVNPNNPPNALAVNPAGIPEDLRREPRWLLWRYEWRDGDWSKVPRQANGDFADSTNRATWTTFDAALAAYQRGGFTGIGFPLGDGFAGFDLDDMRDPTTGNLDPEAQWAIQTLDSYAEVSPSANGCKVFLRGTLPANCRKQNKFPDGRQVETYDSGRYFCVTGWPLPNSPMEVRERTAELATAHAALVAPAAANNGQPAAGSNGQAAAAPVPAPQPGTTADEDTLTRARGYCFAIPPAISGQGGSKATMKAALALVRDFNLPIEDAYRILNVWNQSCVPPWSEKDLWRKVCEANREDKGWGPRGRLLNRDFKLTDLGNAERLIHLHGADLRYCHPWNKWLVWDSTRWKLDDTAAVERRAKETIRRIYGEAANCADDAIRQAIGKHAKGSESRQRLSAMLAHAASEAGIPVLPAQLDAHPMLLNCPNGILDLETGTFREHDRADLLTRVLPVAYDPAATCPEWERALWKVFAGDGELIGFLQRALGYALTGDVREQIMLIFHGCGSNGKTTLLDTFADVLGKDYACTAAEELLVTTGRDEHKTIKAALHGKRLVIASETDDGKRLREGTVKALTGGEPIPARRMREDLWEFKPTHKLILSTNHKPEIKGTDHAIWRRLALVPFHVKFWDEDKGETGPPELRMDKTLPAKLRAELPGILTWAVRGCLGWLRDGLMMPPSVQAATAEYRASQDVLGSFIDDCCVVQPGVSVSAAMLYQTYCRWCADTGEDARSQRAFGTAMTEKGFVRYPNNGVWYRGVAIPAPVAPHVGTP